MRLRVPAMLLLGLTALLSQGIQASAQTAANVLVVINTDSPASVEVGDYYLAKRGIPAENVVRLKTSTGDALSRTDFQQTIEGPVSLWLSKNTLQDQILYIVLTKGIPLRITGTAGRDGTVSSVDSELTLLYRKLSGVLSPVIGRVPNPLFVGDEPMTVAKPISHFVTDIYLVTRLDGFTTGDVKALIDRASAPANTGAFVLDEKATLIDRGGDAWLESAAERLKASPAGNPVVLETTKTIATNDGPVMGYYSWGSNDPANQLRKTGLVFSPGAIGGTFVSTDGRTLIEPPNAWKPSPPDGGPVFRGSFQSLAGDLIRDGLTGVSANVEEPYLDATVRPQILFPAYAAGFNLAESYYLAMPFLSWQTIVIGDPLCRPFPGKTLTPAEVAKPLDKDSELPGLFTERRMAVIALSEQATNLDPAALKLVLRKDSRLSRAVPVDVEATLVEATTLEPRLTMGHLQLAVLYQTSKAYDQAIDRYQRVLKVRPDDVATMNNLAYLMAEHGSATDALPLAERAYRLSKQDPSVTDTLGWVHHMLGDDQTSAAYLEQALRGLPTNADVLIHAATVHVALNDFARARSEITIAARLGAAVTDREDFKALQAKILRQ